MKKHLLHRKTVIFFAILLTIVLWSSLLYFVEPATIVAKLGVYNSALVIFLISVTGGMSMFTTSSLYLAIITFAVGGVPPVLLCVVAGVGTAIGDSIFYYLGYRGRLAISDTGEGKWQERIIRFEKWLSRRPDYIVMGAIFLYGSFPFFPNDILAVSLGLARYNYAKFVIPLLLGNTALLSLIAFLGAAGIEFFGQG